MERVNGFCLVQGPDGVQTRIACLAYKSPVAGHYIAPSGGLLILGISFFITADQAQRRLGEVQALERGQLV